MDLAALVPPGATASRSLVVTEELTVGHWAEGMPPVLGTPFLIYLMEVAAAEVLKPHLPEGWATVGAQVNVTHLAATPLGMTVTATARLVSTTARTATFEVVAHDGAEKVGEGTHVRGLVNLARFEERWKAKAAAAGETRPGMVPPLGARA
jgi:fluoroacetyl-CoA thioesterase